MKEAARKMTFRAASFRYVVSSYRVKCYNTVQLQREVNEP